MSVIFDPSDETFYGSIRRLLGGVDEDTLSNEDIYDPVIIDYAEIELLALVPKYVELGETDKAKVRLAFKFIVASVLCPTMATRVEIEVKTIDTTWKKKAVDYDELANTLWGRAIGLLDGLIESGGESVIFAIAPSGRSVREAYEGY